MIDSAVFPHSVGRSRRSAAAATLEDARIGYSAPSKIHATTQAACHTSSVRAASHRSTCHRPVDLFGRRFNRSPPRASKRPLAIGRREESANVPNSHPLAIVRLTAAPVSPEPAFHRRAALPSGRCAAARRKCAGCRSARNRDWPANRIDRDRGSGVKRRPEAWMSAGRGNIAGSARSIGQRLPVISSRHRTSPRIFPRAVIAAKRNRFLNPEPLSYWRPLAA